MSLSAGQTTIVTTYSTGELAFEVRSHSRIMAATALVVAGLLMGCSREPVQPAVASREPASPAAPYTPRPRQLLCPVSAGSLRVAPLQDSRSHRVVLSWKASAPSPDSASDPLQGYCVYRSTKKKPVFDDQVSINAKPLSGTGCIDDSPEDGKTYYYAVMAITAKSRTSIFSEEVRAQIPTAKRSSSTFPPSSYPLCRGDGVSNPAN